MNPQSTPNSLEVFQLKTLSSSLAFLCSAQHIHTSLRHGRLYLSLQQHAIQEEVLIHEASNTVLYHFVPTFTYCTQTVLHRHSRYVALSARTIPRVYKRVRKDASLYIFIYTISVSGTRKEEILMWRAASCSLEQFNL